MKLISRLIMSAARFTARHPVATYLGVGIPACALMFAGCLNFAGVSMGTGEEVKEHEPAGDNH